MFNILKIRYFSYLLSFLMIGLLFVGIFYKKSKRNTAFLYSVEFSGGIQIHFSSDENVILNTEEIKNILDEKNQFENFSVRQFGKNEFLIRFPYNNEKLESISVLAEEIRKSLSREFSSEIKIIDVSFVGAGVGSQLRFKAILSIIIALILMSFYVWIRFRSFAFSFANAISLFHDILVIILLLLWFDYEISIDIIGAILFILGYSINDTIVIFSRIREHIKDKSEIVNDLKVLINVSVRETFRRTLLTSAFTSLVVLPLWLFGGASLEALSGPILLGIIFGTYSSIGIACAVLYDCLKNTNIKTI